jgi:hypothetical protein
MEHVVEIIIFCLTAIKIRCFIPQKKEHRRDAVTTARFLARPPWPKPPPRRRCLRENQPTRLEIWSHKRKSQLLSNLSILSLWYAPQPKVSNTLPSPQRQRIGDRQIGYCKWAEMGQSKQNHQWTNIDKFSSPQSQKRVYWVRVALYNVSPAKITLNLNPETFPYEAQSDLGRVLNSTWVWTVGTSARTGNSRQIHQNR